MTSKASSFTNNNKVIAKTIGDRMTPVFFVWLWSTGFIRCKIWLTLCGAFYAVVLPHANYTYLSWLTCSLDEI